MREPVNLYMRVENQKEICIGSARTMNEVPLLLEKIAADLRAGMAPDALEVLPGSCCCGRSSG